MADRQQQIDDALNAIWIDQQGGRVSCGHDGGSYLMSCIKADPTTAQHLTPLDAWVRATPADFAEWEADGLTLECETARYSPERARCLPGQPES